MGCGASRDGFGGSAAVSKLIDAAIRGDADAITKLLSNGHTDINQVDSYQESALHKAASNDHAEVCQLLISKGAVLNLRNINGRTPLELAAEKGHRQTCKLLLKLGAAAHEVKNFRRNVILSTLEGHTGRVAGVSITRDSATIVSASHDNTLRVWDLRTGTCKLKLVGHKEPVTAVVTTPDCRYAISASEDRSLKVWDLVDGRMMGSLDGHRAGILSCCMTPDGAMVVSGSKDRSVKVWDMATFALKASLEGHRASVGATAITPDGSLIVSGSEDATIKVWNTESAHLLATLSGHKGAVVSLAVTPDGTRLVSGAYDDSLRVWDMLHYQPLKVLAEHSDAVHALSMSPDGLVLVSTAYDGSLVFWDMEQLCFLTSIEGHTGRVACAEFSPDGRVVVSGADDQEVLVWSMEFLPFIRAVSTGNLATATRWLCLGTDPGLRLEMNGKMSEPPLWHAALAGHQEMCRLLLWWGAQVDAKDDLSRSPLMLAAERKHQAVVELLVENGANLNLRNKDGATPLILAASQQHEEICQLLLSKGADPDVADKKGRTAMHYLAHLKEEVITLRSQVQALAAAVLRNDAEAAQRIIENYPNTVNIPDPSGNTPLHHAVEQGFNDILSLMLKVPEAYPDARNKEQDTPLLTAVSFQDAKCCKVLLDAHAHAGACNKDGHTALHICAHAGLVDVARMLLENGADPNVRNIVSDETPLHIATKANQLEMIKILLAAGCDPNVRSQRGETAVHLAARADAAPVAHLLVMAGGRGDVANHRGVTPVAAALDKGAYATAEILVGSGTGNLDQPIDGFGNTLLHKAVTDNDRKAVGVLLRGHAAVDLPNKQGQTPIDVARSMEMRAMLQEGAQGGSVRQDLSMPGFPADAFGPGSQLGSMIGTNYQHSVLNGSIGGGSVLTAGGRAAFNGRFYPLKSKEAMERTRLTVFCTDKSSGAAVVVQFFGSQQERDHTAETLQNLSNAKYIAGLAGAQAFCVFEDAESQPLRPYALVTSCGERSMGELLLQYPPSRRMALEKLSAMAHQLMMALNYVHSQGVVHCDLKPKNIIDFGSNLLKIGGFERSTDSGTPLQMLAPDICPPEGAYYFVRGQLINSNNKIDMWGAGCILWHMLAGKPLVEYLLPRGRSFLDMQPKEVYEVVAKVRQDVLDDLIGLHVSGTDPRLKAAQSLLKMLLQVNPNTRQRARDLLDHEFLKSATDPNYMAAQMQALSFKQESLLQIDAARIMSAAPAPHKLPSAPDRPDSALSTAAIALQADSPTQSIILPPGTDPGSSFKPDMMPAAGSVPGGFQQQQQQPPSTAMTVMSVGSGGSAPQSAPQTAPPRSPSPAPSIMAPPYQPPGAAQAVPHQATGAYSQPAAAATLQPSTPAPNQPGPPAVPAAGPASASNYPAVPNPYAANVPGAAFANSYAPVASPLLASKAFPPAVPAARPAARGHYLPYMPPGGSYVPIAAGSTAAPEAGFTPVIPAGLMHDSAESQPSIPAPAAHPLPSRGQSAKSSIRAWSSRQDVVTHLSTSSALEILRDAAEPSDRSMLTPAEMLRVTSR